MVWAGEVLSTYVLNSAILLSEKVIVSYLFEEVHGSTTGRQGVLYEFEPSRCFVLVLVQKAQSPGIYQPLCSSLAAYLLHGIYRNV